MISVLLSRAAAQTWRETWRGAAAEAWREVWRFAVAFATGTGRYAVGLIKTWRYRADIHKLHAMSDRQLSDIGLPRSRIEAAVRGGAQDAAAQSGSLRSLFHP